MLAERRVLLDSAETFAAFAKEMSEFLQTSEISETRAFVRSFVKEIMVIPGDALIRYTVPMPDNSFLADRASEMAALEPSVLSTVHTGPPTGPHPTSLHPR